MSDTEKCIFPALLHEPAADLYLRTAGLGAAGRRRGVRSEETGAAPSLGRAGNSP